MKKPKKMPRLTTAPAEPTRTHGARNRSAPKSAHKDRVKLTRPDSAPASAHSKTNPGNKNRAAAKHTHNPIDNLGRYAHKAKLPRGGLAKSVANEMRKPAKQRTYK